MNLQQLLMVAAAQGGGFAVDNTPNQFTFTDQTLVTPSTTVTSDTITLSGMDVGSSAAVTVTGGTYSKNGGAYTASPGTATNGDTFSVQQTSSASLATGVNTVLTVGTVSDTFTSTTYTSIGAELWPQPAFAASTGLTLVRCSVTGGQLVGDGSETFATATATLAGGSINVGDHFRWSFDIAGTLGNTSLTIGGASVLGGLQNPGTYSGVFTVATVTNQDLASRFTDNFAGNAVDNVSIKKVT